MTLMGPRLKDPWQPKLRAQMIDFVKRCLWWWWGQKPTATKQVKGENLHAGHVGEHKRKRTRWVMVGLGEPPSQMWKIPLF